ncbi:hypothetical protein F5051DRAFT_456089 [Lentinula edodes]|nr:hypothetical protein F5051DRAFT_456089 [Lentinula edodes]
MRFDLPYLVFGMLACISIHVQAAPFNGVADDGLGLIVRDPSTSPKTNLRVRASSCEPGNYVSPTGNRDYWKVVGCSGKKNAIQVRFDGIYGTQVNPQGNLLTHLDPKFKPIEDQVLKAIEHLDPHHSLPVVFMNHYKFPGSSKSLKPRKIPSTITGASIQYLEHGGIISIDKESVPTITAQVQADGTVVSCNIRVMDGKVVC